MQNLLQLLQSTASLTLEERSALCTHWSTSIQLKRKDFLIQKGKVERYLYFVQTGHLRIYYPNETEEICVGFGHPSTLICSFPSFIRDEPSAYYIQALKACTLLRISKTDFFQLKEKYTGIHTCWQRLIEEALLGKIERETEMLTFTPEQRVQRLFKRSPHVFQTIPKKYIASYLGMAPETLSRIKLSNE